MRKTPYVWTPEKTNLLRELYPTTPKEELVKIFGLPWNRINDKSHREGFRQYVPSADFSKLLEFKEPRAAMYLGMLLADGHFSKRNGIMITLHKKDRSYLEKMQEYFSYETEIKEAKNRHDCYLLATNHNTVPKIREKFNLSVKKTWNPPLSSDIGINGNPDLFFSLIVGYIDGDGSIGIDPRSGKPNVRFRCHSSWFEIISHIQNFLYCYFGIKKGNDKGDATVKNRCATLAIYDPLLLFRMKEKTNELGLSPYVLDRKWSRITYENTVLRTAELRGLHRSSTGQYVPYLQ
mgnify:CR=1 FL=1